MMVTFISQCEKNALSKTRRVLDAFANRIGTNAWQTVITEEGLSTVKKMLRQTASKSTAVACHWIRSRCRNQFLWVVGNKARFNKEGMVPVNYTLNDIKTDEPKMTKDTNYYANTKKQALDQHSFGVGYISYCLIKKLTPDDEKFSKAAFVAGCLHDLGKVDAEFQNWVCSINNKKSLSDDVTDDGQHIDKGKFTFDKYARHNEISVLLYQFFNDTAYLGNAKLKEFVEHAIYWHHAKPFRKEEYKTFRDIYRKLDKSTTDSTTLKALLRATQLLVDSINKLTIDYQSNSHLQINGFKAEVTENLIDSFKKINLPAYKEYDSEESIENYHRLILDNTKKNIMRSCVITADRLISSLSAETLATLIQDKLLHSVLDDIYKNDNDLSSQIQLCINGFKNTYPTSGRNLKQQEAAQKLRDVGRVAVLKGPAGCGKTKIALEWASLTGTKKIIWVCPRVQVCEGLFLDLTSNDYLPNSNIEICTGDFKYIKRHGSKIDTPLGQEFSGDIIITTIDQIINAIITHTNVTSLVLFMNTHVVFDEYHEYIHMPAFNLLFAELVECKKLQGQNANTLLVSATPNNFFIQELLKIDTNDIISIESFNNSLYQIKFVAFDEEKEDDTNPFFQRQPNNSIVITNTATVAQRSFIFNQNQEKAVLLHGRFKKAHKLSLFDDVFNAFKKDGNQQYDLLRSSPIVQASLNITCAHMVTEFTLAENWLQRLGRLDRFGERAEINQYITAIPQTLVNGKSNGSCARFLSKLYTLHSAKAWYQFLLDKMPADPITINDIYQIYADFYLSELGKKAVEQDLISALKYSVQKLTQKLHDPFCFPKKSIKDVRKKLKKSSLRGDSRYVQMAICKINQNGEIQYINEYACNSSDNIFTMSIDEIEGHDPSGDKNLLSFMHQKNHKILSAKTKKIVKKAHKSFLLINEAIDPDLPIYLSYTDEDLLLTNDQPHTYAIYYVMGEKQPIGALSRNILTNIINHD